MTLATTVELPRLDVSFYSSEVAADPYPLLEQIRALGPVVYNGALRLWMLTGYDDCSRVLSNPEIFSVVPVSSGSRSSSAMEGFGAGAIVHLDGEEHARRRLVWAAAFVPRNLARVELFVRETVERALDGVEQRLRDGEVPDVHRELCRRLPTNVIGHMLGVDPEHYPDIERWSDELLLGFEAMGQRTPEADRKREIASAAFQALGDFLLEEVERRRAHPTDDLIGLMTSAAETRDLRDDDVVANCRALVIGGNETTGKLMSSLLLALGDRDEARHQIAADPSLAPAAVEETLRWRAIAQVDFRLVTADGTDVAGAPAPAGTVVAALLGAANRDPSRWERPDEFDIDRPPQQHLGFGRGPHTCIGLHLARLETRELINAWLRRFPDYRVAGPVDFGSNFTVWGPTTALVALA
jgi:cytochrome P450